MRLKSIKNMTVDIITTLALVFVGLLAGIVASFEEPEPGSAYYLKPYDHRAELLILQAELNPEKYEKICQEFCH